MVSIQEAKQDTNQLYGLIQTVGGWVAPFFDEGILLLAEIAEHDSQCDSKAPDKFRFAKL